MPYVLMISLYILIVGSVLTSFVEYMHVLQVLKLFAYWVILHAFLSTTVCLFVCLFDFAFFFVFFKIIFFEILFQIYHQSVNSLNC